MNRPFLSILLALGLSNGCADLTNQGKQPAPAAVTPCSGLTVDECGAKYQAELVACSAAAQTRAQSEACESSVRAAYGRPARADGGAS